jgi:hypothetical protein
MGRSGRLRIERGHYRVTQNRMLRRDGCMGEGNHAELSINLQGMDRAFTTNGSKGRTASIIPNSGAREKTRNVCRGFSVPIAFVEPDKLLGSRDRVST